MEVKKEPDFLIRPPKPARAAFAKAPGMDLGKAALAAFGGLVKNSGAIFTSIEGFLTASEEFV